MAQDHSPRITTAGIWLASGAGLLGAALILHGPPDPDLAVQMEIIAHEHGRWSGAHWLAAVALSLFTAAGLMMMTGQSRHVDSIVTRSAWAVLTLGALWTMTTAVAEATAVTTAALAGDQAAFTAWWNFSSGKANGFMGLACAVVLIALAESRQTATSMPRMVSLAGAAAAAGSAVGWVLNMWIGVAIGGPIWLISSLLMCVWLVWFGRTLASAKSSMHFKTG